MPIVPGADARDFDRRVGGDGVGFLGDRAADAGGQAERRGGLFRRRRCAGRSGVASPQAAGNETKQDQAGQRGTDQLQNRVGAARRSRGRSGGRSGESRRTRVQVEGRGDRCARHVVALVELDFVAGPARDEHALAGVDVEIVRHVTHFHALGCRALEVDDARLIGQCDRAGRAIEADAIADPLRRCLGGRYRAQRHEILEEFPLGAVLTLLEDERGAAAEAVEQVEFIPVIRLAVDLHPEDHAAGDAHAPAVQDAGRPDAQRGGIFRAHRKKCGTNRLRLPVMRRVSSRRPRPAGA